MTDKQRKVFVGMIIFLFCLSVGFIAVIVQALWERKTDTLVVSISAWILSFVVFGLGFGHGRDYERASGE